MGTGHHRSALCYRAQRWRPQLTALLPCGAELREGQGEDRKGRMGDGAGGGGGRGW